MKMWYNNGRKIDAQYGYKHLVRTACCKKTLPLKTGDLCPGVLMNVNEVNCPAFFDFFYHLHCISYSDTGQLSQFSQ